MPRVVHFEICANDPEMSAEFYRNVFGWEVARWEGPGEYWLAMTGDSSQPGINGGIMRQNETLKGVINTVDVPDIDAFIEKVKQNGGQLVGEKVPVPGVGYQAYCLDVEGNVFGIHQADPNAGMD
jgi:predicted enzyme related to lactoylglutathione lyase